MSVISRPKCTGCGQQYEPAAAAAAPASAPATTAGFCSSVCHQLALSELEALSLRRLAAAHALSLSEQEAAEAEGDDAVVANAQVIADGRAEIGRDEGTGNAALLSLADLVDASVASAAGVTPVPASFLTSALMGDDAVIDRPDTAPSESMSHSVLDTRQVGPGSADREDHDGLSVNQVCLPSPGRGRHDQQPWTAGQRVTAPANRYLAADDWY